ncbi:MAG TPA: alanine racemase [Mycobacteriales bacterium]|nr:alanine racemase [Mycobacteriales bacterium]
MISTAEIDLAAIRHNVRELRGRTRAELMVAVKADGYGHGMVPSARAALAGGATWLAVAYVSEALALRAAGITAPILALIPAADDPLGEAVARGVDISISSQRILDAVTAAAPDRARVHLEIDTGLSRGGIRAAEAGELFDAAAKAAASEAIEIVAVWSHLACADELDNPMTAQQLATYREVLDLAHSRGIDPPLRHLANSAGLLAWPQTHFDLVRPGIAVYGLPPVPAEGFVPAMTLRSQVVLTKRIPAGTGVSYGVTYHAERDTNLALVPLGYGDGIPVRASNRAEVAIGGRRYRIAGRVCMDQFVVELGDDVVAEGSGVEVFGRDVGAEDWARATDTIAYEIVTRVGARVPRTYRGGA